MRLVFEGGFYSLFLHYSAFVNPLHCIRAKSWLASKGITIERFLPCFVGKIVLYLRRNWYHMVSNNWTIFCKHVQKASIHISRRSNSYILLRIKSYWHYKLSIISCSVENFWSAQYIKIAPSGNINWSLLNILAKIFFSIIWNYVLSAPSQRKCNFYRQNTLVDAFRTKSRNIIGRNPSMVIPLLANQGLMPMLFEIEVC